MIQFTYKILKHLSDVELIVKNKQIWYSHHDIMVRCLKKLSLKKINLKKLVSEV